MGKCEKCGFENNMQYDKYCRSCGYELPQEEVEQITEVPVPKKSGTKNKRIGMFVGIIVGLLAMYAVQHFVFNSDLFSIDKSVAQLANEINKNCPMMIDSETKLDNTIALPNKTFQYNYTLVNMVKEAVDTLEIKNALEPNIINFVKTNPQMKEIRDHEITINYYYKDKNGAYLFEVKVPPALYK